MAALPEKVFPDSLEDISRHFGLSQTLVSIKGPQSLRFALGVSQPQMGRLLAHYAGGHTYTRGTIVTWERVERDVRLPDRYAMTEKAREAYRLLLVDVVELASAGQLRLRSQLGPRAWRFRLERDCSVCGRPFVLRRSGQVRCQRCIRSKRR